VQKPAEAVKKFKPFNLSFSSLICNNTYIVKILLKAKYTLLDFIRVLKVYKPLLLRRA